MAERTINPMTTGEVRDTFLNYFAENGHLVISGAGIVPKDDPTLLLINSGMAPMKPYFRGEATPPSSRLANVQICIRTTDLEDVGDSRHGTSFRMMGNWSFGAYGKEGAIDYAMGLVEGGYKMDRTRLLSTVFAADDRTPGIPSDTVSAGHWQNYLPASRIVPSPAEDNFWGPAGDSGPCGPCTEVFFDRGSEYAERSATPGEQLIDGQHIEIWNAGVFMEYDQAVDGTRRDLGRLCVDAGAGLERFAMILQGATSIHEIDQYLPGFNQIRAMVGSDREARIVFDHVKTARILMESGITPDKQGAGYVVRRLARRALGILDMNGKSLATLNELSHTVAQLIDPTPGRNASDAEITGMVSKETEAFSVVLRRAHRLSETIARERVVTGKQVFDAFTSTGIPVDYIRDTCTRNGVVFPEAEYNELMEAHRAKSKVA